MCGRSLYSGPTIVDERPPHGRPTYDVGAVIGSYRILAPLGEGGMGRVYLAEHVRLGRRVALKTLRARYAHNPETVRRFFAEARAVSSVSHDHVIEITDFIEEPGGVNAYVMELLEGQTLRELIEAGPVPLARALDIAVQVSEALAAVHAAGIVHRDLKPDNIFLTERNGRRDFVKVLDFGVAKLLDVEDQTILSMSSTAEGAILGTPEYMSPEQASGKRVDYRSDVYSLGIILYELASGTKPFVADSFGELVVQQLTVTPPAPSVVRRHGERIPRDLDELIVHCLAKEPDRRVRSMVELERRLRRVLVDIAGDGDELERQLAHAGRRRHLVSSAVATAAVLSGLLGAQLIGGGAGELPATAVSRAAAVTAEVDAPRADGDERRADDRFAERPRVAEPRPGAGDNRTLTAASGSWLAAGVDEAPPSPRAAPSGERERLTTPASRKRARASQPKRLRLERDAVMDPFADSW